MRNIKLVMEYDGGRYSGLQRLGKGESDNTIENKLLEVLTKMTEEQIELNFGCRTEAGVHAYQQVANFKTNSKRKNYEIKNYCNRYLPMDIAILEAEDMPERFHATLNTKSKTYLYRLAIGDVPSVFERKYTYYSFHKPEVKVMREAAKLMLGRHDFKDFSTVKKSKSTEKEVYSIDIYEDDKEIQFTIKANDFLHNMARMMVATLVEIGLGTKDKSVISDILNPKSDVVGSMPISAQGLFLQEIEYKDNL